MHIRTQRAYSPEPTCPLYANEIPTVRFVRWAHQVNPGRFAVASDALSGCVRDAHGARYAGRTTMTTFPAVPLVPPDGLPDERVSEGVEPWGAAVLRQSSRRWRES